MFKKISCNNEVEIPDDILQNCLEGVAHWNEGEISVSRNI